MKNSILSLFELITQNLIDMFCIQLMIGEVTETIRQNGKIEKEMEVLLDNIKILVEEKCLLQILCTKTCVQSSYQC